MLLCLYMNAASEEGIEPKQTNLNCSDCRVPISNVEIRNVRYVRVLIFLEITCSRTASYDFFIIVCLFV